MSILSFRVEAQGNLFGPGDLTLGCARVSCHDQKDDLPRQADRLREHGKKDGQQVEVLASDA